MPLALGIIAGVGAAVQLYGMIAGAKAQSNAAERSAYFKHLQAQELIERQQINEQIMREQAVDAQKDWGSSAAGTGFAATGLGGKLRIHQRMQEAIEHTRRDAEFKARMLRAGGDIESGLASDQMTAGYISGFGSLLGTAARIYEQNQKPSNPVDIPKVGD